MSPSIHAIHPPGAVNISAHLGAARPFRWLELGWEDFRANPGPSIAHGLLLAGIGWLILLFCSANVGLLAAAVSGFVLVGPVFAAGFYELSRLRAAGERATFDRSLEGAARNGRSLAALGLVLAALTIVWAWLSTLLFTSAFGAALPVSGYWTVVDWDIGGTFLLTYLVTGAVLALLAFVISAVAAPMLYDRGIPTGDAIFTSAKTALFNPVAMAVWAVLVAVLTAIGFATLLIGLVVILPVLGHATWHAYRDLIGVPEGTVGVTEDPHKTFWDVH
jgi:uncharacterized membrane protein